MTITTARPVGTTTDPACLLTEETTARLASRITVDHPDIALGVARRIVAQAAAFIAASGQAPGRGLSPSRMVDIGWHTFILHTVDYAIFCEQVAGRFVHHVPTEDESETKEAAETVTRTMTAIEAAGYTVDSELWLGAAECSQCHAGCTESPNGGKK